ncbi:hypothetical protein [Streptomyces kanamyceticus]|uniref:Secreted protein n=1 Tax=Streptomyces kanamyceticus TaxID=1967 RepID=A0A5J6GIM8_STRKN|nr:hypothetical protein [Streptomyces kanamyceticus]QEU94292.1 hypothetical protein CP970_28340 [Streptomyces kanamyceticus]
MKKSTRGALAVALACAAAAGAGAGTAAQAAEQPSVTVPLNGLEYALDMEAPELTTGVPVPLPGEGLDGPRYAQDSLLPERAVPRFPVSGVLPDTQLSAPLSEVLGEDTVESLGAEAQGSSIEAVTPTPNLDLPLTAPQPDLWGLPAPKLPSAGLEAPELRAQPAANLGLA